MHATCRVHVTQPFSRRTDGGGIITLHREVVDAYWRFDDGVEIHLSTPRDTTHTVYLRGRSIRDATPTRELTRKPRVYVDSGLPFDVLEDLANRVRRPHQLLKGDVHDALERIGMDGALQWSQKAGCSCGCSPGFILTYPAPGVDVWVTLPGRPTVDESKTARDLTGVML